MTEAPMGERAARRPPHRILIVGGGAGGLELATRLGEDAGRRGLADIVLVDAGLTHLWKPLLHEVAAGTLDLGNNEIDYLAHARRHHFRFQLGAMCGLNRARREVTLAALHDERGEPLAPERALAYDTLVMAVGSEVNDFGTPGVRRHALRLDTLDDARCFHRRLLSACLRSDLQPDEDEVAIEIVVIGGGATGVELAAELHETLQDYARVGMSGRPLARRSRITVVEAAERILSALPQNVGDKVVLELRAKGVQVLTGERVAEVREDGVVTAAGRLIPAQLVVWAAGVKAPDWLHELDGLETTRGNQLVVRPTLQTTRDDAVFAMGDCAACPLPARGGQPRWVPPLAQAAHQQAAFLARSLARRVRGRAGLPSFRFQEHGSLISVGREVAVGTLIGRLSGHRFFVDGLAARLTYRALYRGYLMGLHGFVRMLLTTLGSWLTRSTRPRVKLH